MKRILTIFKELQDSGQEVTIIGHFSIQTGIFQNVASIDNAREQPETALSETDAGKNTNRYITEQEQNSEKNFYPISASVKLSPALLEVIDAWQNLPDSIKTGIVAIAVSTQPA